ncbi:Cytochrome o ubiquinol oxidase subunit 3 [Budvicia aquatica]|uniref:Cytochrome o ubiquinol oxidase subunit 3 n=1 Tax=Budvicia aquatica TaxID=82979 RepID=A0A484ZC87_9GAMM|nr:Cytochrome o ubiquinol oxidase subunit 3 [Budvicia aquatica]
MSTDTLVNPNAHAHGHEHHDHDHETSSKTVFGFWIYLMSDCILFCRGIRNLCGAGK